MNSTINNCKNNNLKAKLQAVGGLVLTGAGLSMSIDAGIKRTKGSKWFLYGTIALVVFNAGLCLVAGSVRHANQK